MDENWINKEFKKNSFKDKRLEKRFLKVANSFCDLPSASLAQQAEDWAEAKGAYRFFKNDNVCTDDFFSSHQEKTSERAEKYSFVLGIQDTTTINYKGHSKKKWNGINSEWILGMSPAFNNRSCPQWIISWCTLESSLDKR